MPSEELIKPAVSYSEMQILHTYTKHQLSLVRCVGESCETQPHIQMYIGLYNISDVQGSIYNSRK